MVNVCELFLKNNDREIYYKSKYFYTWIHSDVYLYIHLCNYRHKYFPIQNDFPLQAKVSSHVMAYSVTLNYFDRNKTRFMYIVNVFSQTNPLQAPVICIERSPQAPCRNMCSHGDTFSSPCRRLCCRMLVCRYLVILQEAP